MSADYIRAVPTINLTDDELAAVTAAIRRAIEDDRFPHAPRLDPLRAALGKFEAARRANPAPEGPAASQSRQARAAITAPICRWRGCGTPQRCGTQLQLGESATSPSACLGAVPG